MMPKQQKYPNSLRKYRKAAGLRQQEVAHALKLNTCERISKWENGHSVPALGSLFQLAALYHSSPQELYNEMYRSIVNPIHSFTVEAVSEVGMAAGE